MHATQVYDRAVGNVPLPLDAPEKRYWQRYIYLWLNYALWEETEAGDPARTREVYRNCLKLIPHRLFTFAKVGGEPPNAALQQSAHTGLHQLQCCVRTARQSECSGTTCPADRLLPATGVGDGGELRDPAAAAGCGAADPGHGRRQLPQ